MPIRFASSQLINNLHELTNIVCIATDMTEYQKKEKKLSEREKKYRSILENIKEGYFEVDLEGNIIFFNDSVCEIMRSPPNEIIGKNFRKYTNAHTADRIQKHFNNFKC